MHVIPVQITFLSGNIQYKLFKVAEIHSCN